jgi:hypothetical protein
MNIGHEKSEDRLAIEAVLKRATPANPVSARDIAIQTDIELQRVRNLMSTIVFEQGAYSCVQAGGRGAMYAAGPRPAAPKGDNMPAPRTAPPSGRYEPAPWNPPRAGCTQHEDCPSIWNGEVTRYTRPFSMSGKALEPAVMRGGVS